MLFFCSSERHGNNCLFAGPASNNPWNNDLLQKSNIKTEGGFATKVGDRVSLVKGGVSGGNGFVTFKRAFVDMITAW